MNSLNDFKNILIKSSNTDISENYFRWAQLLDAEVELYSVLNYFGISEVGSFDRELQINCLLPNHGTRDSKKSSRYYRDSNTNTARVHCFKCDKTLSGFWYFYYIKKDSDLDRKSIMISFIDAFKPSMATDFFLEAEKSIDTKETLSIKQSIDINRKLKITNKEKFIEALYQLITNS